MEGETGVTLYPEGDETNILNFKRGIISALIVPVMEKEESKDMVHKHVFFFLKDLICKDMNCLLLYAELVRLN